MKKLLFIAIVFLSSSVLRSQIFSPITTTGYSLDAIAENTTALATTGGAIDGSNYVLYSAAYGALYSVANGLPNTGLISSGTRTYQLQPYTQENLLYVPAGLMDTIFFTTPASYAGLSLLAFSTEGDGNLTASVVFTDNSNQAFTNQALPDWFNNGNTVITGFDRVSRSIGTPANLSGNPKMYYIDLPIQCVNRTKLVSYVVIQNTSSNARNCVLAVSGTGGPTFSASSMPVTCVGGINGSASITATGGLPPYTYTWSTTPPLYMPLANNLAAGVYTYSAQDNGGCVVTATIAVSQSLIPEPDLSLSSTLYTICSGGTFTMGATGAATYSWTNGPNTSIYSPGPLTTLSPTTYVYNVSGHTSVNCLRTGSISILVNPVPVITFTGTLPSMCKNSPAIHLGNLVQQTGGNFSGTGVITSSFMPSVAGTGTFTIVYTKTDAGCTNSVSTSVQVFSLAAPQMSTPVAFCANLPAISLSVSPSGGTLGGIGVSNGQFDPAISGAGVFPVGYTISSGPCLANSAISVTVHSIPTASISGKTFFCVTHASYVFNGQPTGGAFSGPGLTGNIFDPKKAVVSNSNILVYTYKNNNGCTDTAAIRVTVSNCVGIQESTANAYGLEVYPNPSNGVITLKTTEKVELGVFNAAGQLIRKTALDESNGYQSTLTDLAAGIYFIRPESSTQYRAIKVVVNE